ncbi:MAG: multicopper oxidase domain-containing protein, partial [Oscillospiraceae bacterium]|nr:multicopper oxidase domain-containing protein [Oscillospiraceae bacterium]
MVVSPNLESAECVQRDGVKHFELVAEPVNREVLPELFLSGYGYNGQLPGPTVVCRTGDCVNIKLINRLNEPTSLNINGLDLPNELNGIPAVDSSPPVQSGEAFDYRFIVRNRPGTYIYTSGTCPSRQQTLGMAGAFIIDDGKGGCNRDFALLLQEFSIDQRQGQLGQGTYSIAAQPAEGNFFCINGGCFPEIEPICVIPGGEVRLRLLNLSGCTQPMSLSGHTLKVIAKDGFRLPQPVYTNTVPVAPGETVDVVF